MAQHRLKTAWFQDLPKADQENFKQLVLSSEKVLDKLRKIVYNMSIEEERVKTIDYDSPSWSHKQAHLNGKAEAFREIMNLLDFKEY